MGMPDTSRGPGRDSRHDIATARFRDPHATNKHRFDVFRICAFESALSNRRFRGQPRPPAASFGERDDRACATNWRVTAMVVSGKRESGARPPNASFFRRCIENRKRRSAMRTSSAHLVAKCARVSTRGRISKDSREASLRRQRSKPVRTAPVQTAPVRSAGMRDAIVAHDADEPLQSRNKPCGYSGFCSRDISRFNPSAGVISPLSTSRTVLEIGNSTP